jgi:hypothetical protein
MGVIANRGDSAMSFIWRNKGSLAVASTMTAFLANPDPFIDGTTKAASAVSENAVKPMVHGTAQAVSSFVWGTTLIVVVIILAAMRAPGAFGTIANHVFRFTIRR